MNRAIKDEGHIALQLTSDSPVETHTRVYDLEEEVPPGEETALSFEFDLTWRFEREEDEMGHTLGVPLVQPR